MTPEHKQLARIMFQLKVHRSEGFEYENLFGQVMGYARPGFKKVKPYGNQGDRGNDAYEPEIGRYYQVFAPENAKTSKSAAIKKAQTDFEQKLLPYWGKFCTPQEYYFVLNDKYGGTILDIEKVLSEIKTAHGLNEARSYLSKDLEDEFIKLDEDMIFMIVGGVPQIDSSQFLDYTVLGDVINHILETPSPFSRSGKLISPDFDDKILFNDLIYNGHWLRAKQLEVWQIDDYYSKNSNFAKQSLRDALAAYYAESVAVIPLATAGNSAGDLRFVYILDKIAPQHSSVSVDRLRKDAALVLMSKYFETCDIFEEPKNANAS